MKIKHGKVYPVKYKSGGKTHTSPIEEFITKGKADAKQKITIQPLACDVKGAKRFNEQQCVIAKCLNRTFKPEAVAVGRSLAYVVIDGVAIRFKMPLASKRLVDEFDQRGRARSAPVELIPPHKSWTIGNRPQKPDTRKSRKKNAVKRPRGKRIGTRVAGGGVAA